MGRDKMAPTHDRPHTIGTACPVDQQGAAWGRNGSDLVSMAVSLDEPPPRNGIVPFMPSLSSHPRVFSLLRGEFPFDILRPGYGPLQCS